jgi:hypothetical protein
MLLIIYTSNPMIINQLVRLLVSLVGLCVGLFVILVGLFSVKDNNNKSREPKPPTPYH